MSDFVLRPVKQSPSNNPETSPANNGVLRDVKILPVSADTPTNLVDANADQYRAAILNGPENSKVEYLIWAANNSNLAQVEDDSWAISEGSGTIPEGSNSVLDTNSPDGGIRQDGSPRVLVRDNGVRSIYKILSVTGIRGDDATSTPVELTLGVDFTCANPESGVVDILDNSTTQNFLKPSGGSPPSFSRLRGDRIVSVSYVLQSVKFWWTRNDSYLDRFGWDATTQKWAPLKGNAPITIGRLLPDTNYRLSPAPQGLVEGLFLPGNITSDSYAMIRLGESPGASSLPVSENPLGSFDGVLVVSDASASAPFSFGSFSPPPSAVVGVTSGELQWNPDFIADHSGSLIWYLPQTFLANAGSGSVGLLTDSEIFISPIPNFSEHPLLRIGSRKYLAVQTFESEASLDVSVIPEGAVGVSISTGKLKFSAADIAKATVGDVDFQPSYLGASVFYDGLTLNQVPQPTKQSALAIGVSTSPEVISNNDLFIPDSEPLFGLGVSGVLTVPDGTGALPSSGESGIRPGGDDPLATYTGLVRQLGSFADSILFTRQGVLDNLVVVDKESDFPSLAFEVPENTVYVSREKRAPNLGSNILLSALDRQKLQGENLYYLDALLTPSLYFSNARLVSRVRNRFTLTGEESFVFAIDGVVYTWLASVLGAGSFSASDVAASLDLIISGSGSVYALNGSLVMEAGDVDSGVVEIGFGAANQKNLSGCAALGFMPGWRVDTANPETFWQADSGVSFGLHRSSVNLDSSGPEADFKAFNRFEDALLSSSIQPIPFLSFSNPPIRDFPGYDSDKFFKVSLDTFSRVLNPFSDVVYNFDSSPQPRFSWIAQSEINSAIVRATATFFLGQNNVVPATLLSQLGGGVYLSESGEPLTYQQVNTDYLLSEGTGTLNFIERVSSLQGQGYKGSFVSGLDSFEDSEFDFVVNGVTVGDHLKLLSGDLSDRVYIITGVSAGEVTVHTAFSTTSGAPVSWEIYRGESGDVYDPSALADAFYEPFTHLPEETFSIRLLNLVGVVPEDDASQISNRLSANIADVLLGSRTASLRYGLRGVDSSTVTFLQQSELGVLANGLVLPGVGSDRFVQGSFSLRIGNVTYSHGGSLSGVVSFSPTIPAGNVEYLTSTGELAFASDILSDFESFSVLYAEEFLPASFLSADSVEVNALTGELNLPSSVLADFGGESAYFVETLSTVGRVEVSINPLNGSLSFLKPLREGQIVEVSYYQADSSGGLALDEEGSPIQIIEFLPLYVRSESATRINSRSYRINSLGKTIDSRIIPVFYVGNSNVNYGSLTRAILDFETGVVTFRGLLVSDLEVVKVSYGVLEAFGGETAYTTSARPIYRPPFYLPANTNQVSLSGDRSSDVLPGKLLRLGARCFYVKSSVFDSGAGITTVEFYPSYSVESGSRAPGNDLVSVLTSEPVISEVDGVPVSDYLGGFLLPVIAPYNSVRKGQRQVQFEGDLVQFAKPGHVLDIGGVPNIIANSSLINDGLNTVIEVIAPFDFEYVYGQDAVRLSVRPVYPEGASTFVGVSPFLDSEESELVLFSSLSDPGIILVRNIDYESNPANGQIRLLGSYESGLSSGSRLFFRYTKNRVISPKQIFGSTFVPRIRSVFSHLTTPSADNGLLGLKVYASYVYHNPDSFYFEVLPLSEYLSQFLVDRVSSVFSQNGGGGAVVSALPVNGNSYYGTFTTEGRLEDCYDKDRAARYYLSQYHNLISSFESVSETLTGDFVGSGDGKFKFFIGEGKDYAPPGYEDAITGRLNPSNLWSRVVLAETSDLSFPVRVNALDPVVDPADIVLSDAEISGSYLSPDKFSYLWSQQLKFSRNDVDDVVLVSRESPLVSFSGVPPVQNFVSYGSYKPRGYAHKLSRIFPEKADAYLTTFPGVGADLANGDVGVYTYAKSVTNPDGSVSVASTFNTPIGVLSNSAVGSLTNITDASIRKRYPVARIFSYSPSGYPGFEAATTGRPSLILSQVRLNAFPVDPATGYPDTSRLRSLSSAGDAVYDIVTGNPDLSLPGFKTQVLPLFANNPQQLALGKVTGEIIPLFAANSKITVSGSQTFSGVYVDTVYQGCVITLRASDSEVIGSPTDIVTVNGSGIATPVDFESGDTLLVIPATGIDTTPSTLSELAANLPTYRIGVDLELNKLTGEIIDITQPSLNDLSNLALKEELGQNPPLPVSALSAVVGFSNRRTSPLKFPSLEGLQKNDSGDETVPYINSVINEHSLLRSGFSHLLNFSEDSSLPGAVYPEEITSSEGLISSSLGVHPPSLLVADVDVTPVTTAGSYTANSRQADARSYDLLLLDIGQSGLPSGSQGIHTIGDLQSNGGTNSYLEVPRFVTQTRRGDRVRYVFDAAMAHITDVPGSTGITVEETGGNTVFDISTVSGLVLDDGTNVSVGGLNNIVSNPLLSFPNENSIYLYIYDQISGALLETVRLTGDPTATLGPPGGVSFGGSGTTIHATPAVFNSKTITVPATGFVNLGALGGGPGPHGPFDFSITVNTATSGLSATDAFLGSATAKVESDRLTFSERFDLSSVQPLNTFNPLGIPFNGRLDVATVTGPFADDLSVNSVSEINGGIPLTFLERAPGVVGVFSSAAPSGSGNEEGSIKAQSFQGFANTPIADTDVRFSVVPSSDHDASGIICYGEGLCEGGSDSYDNRITEISVLSGALSNINSGDLLVIKEASDSFGAPSFPNAVATTKAGTYVVKDVVESDNVATHPDRREVLLRTSAGDGAGWVSTRFPTLESFDIINSKLFISDLLFFENPSVISSPTGHAFSSGGRVYVILSLADLSDTTPAVFNAAAVSAFYTSVDSGSNAFENLSDYRDAGGNVITANDFLSRVYSGAVISGMHYFPMNPGNEQGLPVSNTVGVNNSDAVYGLSGVSLVGAIVGSASATLEFDTTSGEIESFPSATGGVLIVEAKTENPSHIFSGNPDSASYPNIPGFLSLANVTSAKWQTINRPAAIVSSLLDCLLPNTGLETSTALTTNAFWAQAGVFLEPSWPRPVQNLVSASPRSVDASNSLLATEVGMRTLSDFTGAVLSSPEAVRFEIRRSQRFQSLGESLAETVQGLRSVYEIRRGVVTDYTSLSSQLGVLEATSGTQFGAFDNALNNINAGDVFRLLNIEGVVIEEIEVVGVRNGSELLLASPGLLDPNPVGKSFEVYLSQPLIPQEQIAESLVSEISTLIRHSKADYSSNSGGYVSSSGNYALDVNQLKDSNVDGVGSNVFSSLGVQAGDYLLVPPSGELVVPGGPQDVERGSLALGDRGVSGRVGFSSGTPSALDDNRGVYAILEVGSDTLGVSGATNFSGTWGASDVTFGGSGREYAVYPTVSGSLLTGGVEGQVDLRPTEYAVSGSFSGSYLSIAPFSYRIVRTNNLVSDFTRDLILTNWDKTLTMVDINQEYVNTSGDFYRSQAQDFMSDVLGSSLSKVDQLLLLGAENFSPYLNSESSSGLLDRRFWTLDYQLDYTSPFYVAGVEYTEFLNGAARPVLPDFINSALVSRDKLRDLRYVWLDYRTNLNTGTLAQLSRWSLALDLERANSESLNTSGV